MTRPSKIVGSKQKCLTLRWSVLFFASEVRSVKAYTFITSFVTFTKSLLCSLFMHSTYAFVSTLQSSSPRSYVPHVPPTSKPSEPLVSLTYFLTPILRLTFSFFTPSILVTVHILRKLFTSITEFVSVLPPHTPIFRSTHHHYTSIQLPRTLSTHT